MSDIFQKLLQRVPKDTAQFVDQSMDITLTIKDLLRKKGLTQKDLAQKLGKSEAEISKWLTTGYNLTLKTIAKIEVALEEQIIIPAKFVAEYEGSYQIKVSPTKVYVRFRQRKNDKTRKIVSKTTIHQSQETNDTITQLSNIKKSTKKRYSSSKKLKQQ